MGLEKAKTGKLLYHLTSLNNLESIIKRGLLPRRIMMQNQNAFFDIADQNIISKRQVYGLDQYTPFHFHPYSAFDVAVKSRYNAQEMVYLCIGRELAIANDFKILPKHPLSQSECVLYDYREGFEQIDWDVLMEANRVDNYAKEVKMAECLTDKIIPINYIEVIFVPSEEVKEIVLNMLQKNGINTSTPYVYVQSVWFNY